MKPVIRELAEAAGFYVPHFDEDDQDIKKIEAFADLLIAECITWINENVGQIDSSARGDLYRHFNQVTPQKVIPISHGYEIEPHVCPYKSEILGDCDTLCTCDEDNTHNCAQEI